MAYKCNLPAKCLQAARYTQEGMYIAGSANRDNEVVGRKFGHGVWSPVNVRGGMTPD